MPKENLILEVKFQKIRNKVKYTLPVRMVCEHGNIEMPNSMTLDKKDGLIVSWLGDVEKAFKKSTTIFKKVNINQAYDKCDKPKSKGQ